MERLRHIHHAYDDNDIAKAIRFTWCFGLRLPLIESCRRRKIDPWKYLVWILEELPALNVTADTFARHTPAAYAEKLRPNRHAKKSA